MGIGAAILGFVGASAFAATAVGGIVAGAITGAIVGAAIGGLASAVTCGDIGKGILFGAIGGAVTGGLTTWASGAGGLGGTVNAVTTAGPGEIISGLAPQTSGTMISKGLEAAGSLMKSGGTEVLAGFVTEAGKVLFAPEEEILFSETEEGYRLGLETQLEKQRIASAASAGGSSRGAGHDPAGMASVALKREQWQYDVSKAEQMEKQRTEAMKSIRKLKKPPTGKEATSKKSTITTLDEKRAAERAAKEQTYITPITPYQPPALPPTETPTEV